MNYYKNRNRSPYSFANINLLDRCNVNCYFCLGKDIEKKIYRKRCLTKHFNQWPNLNEFLTECYRKDIEKIYLTGQNTDPLMYKYLSELIDSLQDDGFKVGIRTNGYLASPRMNIINTCKEEIGYSVHTLNKNHSKCILGRETIPDWYYIFKKTTAPMRVSLVVNRYNIGEIDDILDFLSQFENIRYVQLRRVSTDMRYDFLEIDMEIFEWFFNKFSRNNPLKYKYEHAEVYEYKGLDVVFWRTVATTANSLNYFTDGTISDEYFIIEGYNKYSKEE